MTLAPRSVARPLEALLVILTLGVVGASALGLLAESFWMFELLTHFRLQFLAVQLPLLVVCLWRHRWVLFAATLPFTVVNAAVVAPYWPRETAICAPTDAVALMSANLFGGNHDYSRFVDVARREQPDLLLLLEYNSRWGTALSSLLTEYPHRIVAEREDFFGLALFSRIPLTDASVIDLLGVPAVVARLDLGAGDAVRFIGLHLSPPMSAREASERNAQLDFVGQLAAAEPGPLIVAGDFNVSPYSPVLADWLERSALTDTRRGRGFGMSWPVSLPVLGIPIDHVLVSEDFLVAAHYYGPAFGSDHYPVVTRLSLRGKQ
jgi:endonuclease/exonuclease/phosphatase (EEP) superfamily protein YafD